MARTVNLKDMDNQIGKLQAQLDKKVKQREEVALKMAKPVVDKLIDERGMTTAKELNEWYDSVSNVEAQYDELNAIIAPIIERFEIESVEHLEMFLKQATADYVTMEHHRRTQQEHR